MFSTLASEAGRTDRNTYYEFYYGIVKGIVGLMSGIFDQIKEVFDEGVIKYT